MGGGRGNDVKGRSLRMTLTEPLIGARWEEPSWPRVPFYFIVLGQLVASALCRADLVVAQHPSIVWTSFSLPQMR